MALNTGRSRVVGLIVLVLLIGALSFAVGVVVTGGPSVTPQVASDTPLGAGEVGSAPGYAVPEAAQKDAYGNGATAPPLAGDDAKRSSSDGDGSMVIRTSSMEMRVERVETALEGVRSAARKSGADITDLQIQTGVDPGPIPLGREDSQAAEGPATAFITLRVPADRLDSLRSEIAKVGRVITQSTSASDVGQQHADLSARLKNLKAQEARLRQFFSRATKVDDLLAIERELSRVRGEIEAMQAQVDYLDRQVERATLTVTMTEPGPVVRPDSGDWGFIEAITAGIQAAADILKTLITGLIAIAPLVLIALLIWLVVRGIARRRASRRRDTEEARMDERTDEME